MQIPNVRLIIPGLTSKTIYCPEVVVPLYKELWKGFIEDEFADPIRVEKVPAGKRHDAFRFSYYDSVFDFRMELVNKFSATTRIDRRPVWENTYPGDAFERRFAEWAKANKFDVDADTEEVEVETEASKAMMSIRAVRGITKAHADDLVFENIRIVRDLAKADAEKVSEAVNITYRAALKWVNNARRMIGLPPIKNEALEDVTDEEAEEVQLI